MIIVINSLFSFILEITVTQAVPNVIIVIILPTADQVIMVTVVIDMPKTAVKKITMDIPRGVF